MHFGIVFERHSQWVTLKKLFQCLVNPYPSVPRHLDRSQSLNNLANALLDRFRANAGRDHFRKTGSMTDQAELEDISMLRESLSLCPTTHSGRRQVLTDVARALETRSKASSIQSDLSEATSLCREALAMPS